VGLERQVLASVGGLVLLFATIVGVALLLLVELKEHQARLNDRDVPYSVSVTEASLDAKAAANDERGYLLTGNRGFLTEFRADASMTRDGLADAADAAQSAAQRDTIRTASGRFDRWVRATRREFAAYESGDPTAAVAAAIGPNRSLRKSYERSLEHAQARALAVVAEASRQIDARSHFDVVVLTVLLAVMVVIGVGVALWLVRAVVRPIGALSAIFSRSSTRET
jgi:methyl-accepting chemotaxis protein